MEPAVLSDDTFIRRVVVVPNPDTGHERMAHVKSPGHPAIVFSFGALALIPGAPTLIFNFTYEYYICFERNVNDLLVQFQQAADYVEAKQYQLSTWPLAIAPRPWTTIVHHLLRQ